MAIPASEPLELYPSRVRFGVAENSSLVSLRFIDGSSVPVDVYFLPEQLRDLCVSAIAQLDALESVLLEVPASQGSLPL